MPDNRVTLDGDGNIHLAYKSTNDDEADRLYHELKKILNHVGLAEHHVLDKNFYMDMSIPVAGVAHQAGTCRFGTDPATSVLDEQLQGARGRQPLRRRHQLLPEHRRGEPGAHRDGERDPRRRAPARTARPDRRQHRGDEWPRRREAERRQGRPRVVQGIALVTFPAASTIFTSPSEYGLSSTAYGAMFVPQAITAVAASLLGGGLGATRRHAPGVPGRAGRQPRRDDAARRQRAVHEQRGGRVRAAAVRDGEPRRRLRLHGPGAQHVHGGVQPGQGRLVGPRAQRAARTRHRARAAVRRDLRRPRLLVGAAGLAGVLLVALLARRACASRCDRTRAPEPGAGGRPRRARSRRGSGSTPCSRSATASARR